jgi:glutamyl-Q tRNA(Asp) synthetase
LTPLTGRFAPSPSGPLHFGSLVAGLASYCQAKSQQGNWLLRIEDVDTPRVVAGACDQILRDLEAFGFEWDGAISYQSDRFEKYQHYLDKLLNQGDCYACECSRRTLREQGVPSGPLGQIYPGNCRLKQLALENHSIRLNTEHAQWIKFFDRVYGEFALNLPESVGDFVLKRADNIYAYHLAVVVDDELQNITEVVRGADLLENTCLHIYLQQKLGFKTPDYMHIPLVNNAQGVKLSKQTGANALDHQNSSRQLLAALSHLGQAPQPELENARPTEILQWAVDNWNTVSIPVERPAVAETFED